MPVYNVAISVRPKKSAKPVEISLSRPFAEWFDLAGHFIVPPFQTMLATSVPAIGQLDPKRVAPAQAAGVEAADQKYSAEMLDMLAASTPGMGSTGSSAGSISAKKGGKRRKA